MKAQSTANSSANGIQTLSRIGAIAAILMPAIIIIQMVFFVTAPPPYDGNAVDWFNIFQNNKLIGLIDFEFLMVLYMLLAIPVSLALYMLLRNTDPYLATLYITLTLIGVISFIVARPALEMLYLSTRYAAALTEAEKEIFVAAGEAKLAAFDGMAFHISYLLGSLSGLLISLVMLKTRSFSKTTSYVRIASSICDLGLYVPTVGIYISIFSVLFLFVWDILIARRLFQLAHSPSTEMTLVGKDLVVNA